MITIKWFAAVQVFWKTDNQLIAIWDSDNPNSVLVMAWHREKNSTAILLISVGRNRVN